MRINLITALMTGMALLLLSASGLAMSDPVEDLKSCARTEDNAARLACYDALAAQALAEEPEIAASSGNADSAVFETSAETATVEAAVTAAAPSPSSSDRLPDELGISANVEKKSFRGHVRSCREMSNDRWYFYFESGQVWKQANDKKYQFTECDFDVTITKDFFGYKMKIDGGNTIRVRREK